MFHVKRAAFCLGKKLPIEIWISLQACFYHLNYDKMQQSNTTRSVPHVTSSCCC